MLNRRCKNIKKQICDVSRCECGRMNITKEDEENHIAATGHKTMERAPEDKNRKYQVGIMLLAAERNIEFI